MHIAIPKRKNYCSIDNEPFTRGEFYFSLLEEAKNGEFDRRDFCEKCWAKVHADFSVSGKKYVFWKAFSDSRSQKNEHPQQKKTIPERAEILFKEMMESPDFSIKYLFLMALYLARAKKLFLRTQRQEFDKTFLIYESLQQDEFISIEKVEISNREKEEFNLFFQQRVVLQSSQNGD